MKVGSKVSTLRKAQYANDIFTTEPEAISRVYGLRHGWSYSRL